MSLIIEILFIISHKSNIRNHIHTYVSVYLDIFFSHANKRSHTVFSLSLSPPILRKEYLFISISNPYTSRPNSLFPEDLVMTNKRNVVLPLGQNAAISKTGVKTHAYIYTYTHKTN